MIIKLCDEDEGEYPFLKININDYHLFLELLNKYRKEEEMYNLDDFLLFLKDNDFKYESYYIDTEVYF